VVSFRRAPEALSFAAAIRAETGSAPTARRGAAQEAAWVFVRPHRPTDVELAQALGGRVHSPDGPDLVSMTGQRYPWADLQQLPGVTWVELAAAVAPGPDGGEQREVLVVTTGGLAKWIIDKYRSADLDLMVGTAQLRSTFRARSREWPAVVVRVSGRGGHPVPAAFSRALASLPDTVVCRPGNSRLLVDYRLVLPFPDDEMARQVPAGQTWLLTGGMGVWQLTERGPEFPPPLRAARSLQPPPAPQPARFPPDLTTEVTLVQDGKARTVDALLLSDEDLVALRRLLTGSPAAERAFMILGPGYHLFADPGRDASAVPLGLPLHKIGPGALYHEVGYRVHPSLPGPARAQVFDVNPESLVILLPGRALRFSLDRAVPVWSLWLQPVVAAAGGQAALSAYAVDLLARADAADARSSVPELSAGLPDPDRAARLAEGFRLEQQGKLAEAARKYWEAGDPALAARLFELAAAASEAGPARAGSAGPGSAGPGTGAAGP
jgi:hypothetical protein